MSASLILLVLLGGALLVPLFGGGDEEDEGENLNEIRGTFGDDTIDGTPEADSILAWTGDDVINGLGGDDDIRPGEGNDIVEGGAGDDNIKGSPGDDDLRGGDGFDTIFGGADNDRIDGGADADFLAGGDGNDVIFGGYGHSGPGGEPIESDRGAEFIRGDVGNDTIYMWGEGGLARGNDGEDTLILVTGDATLEAGAGAGDTFYILANVSDEQLTEATISDFDVTRDTLVMTIDYTPDGGTPPDVSVTYSEVTVDGVNGLRVDAVFVGPGDVPTQSEAATAFLPGVTISQMSTANVDVVLTTDADLTAPVSTMTQVLTARPII